jgi:hypothetical protein
MIPCCHCRFHRKFYHFMIRSKKNNRSIDVVQSVLEGNTSITLILKYNDSSKLCYLKRCILVYLIAIKTNDWPHFEQHQLVFFVFHIINIQGNIHINIKYKLGALMDSASRIKSKFISRNNVKRKFQTYVTLNPSTLLIFI